MNLIHALCGVALLFSTASLAHSAEISDNDEMVRLPVETKFTALQAVNVKPGVDVLYIQNGHFLGGADDVTGAPVCAFHFTPSSRDRLLRAGRSWSLSHVG